MEDDIRYYELTQCLSSSAQEELSIKFEEYKIELKSFLEIELLKLRSEARNDARHGRKMFEEFIKSPTDDSLESILYSENMRDFKDRKRERLEKPLRNFLIKELTKLKMMSTL
jgi:hypothetical protein